MGLAPVADSGKSAGATYDKKILIVMKQPQMTERLDSAKLEKWTSVSDQSLNSAGICNLHPEKNHATTP